MNIKEFNEINKVKFDLYSPEDIIKISVAKINQNKRTGDGSVYDLHMGPIDNQPCITCKQNNIKCPGHYGHINLVMPIFHPLFFNKLENILKLICVKCYRCIFSGVKNSFSLSKNPEARLNQLINKLRKINYCTSPDCLLEQPNIKFNYTDQIILLDDHVLSPSEVFFLLSNVLLNEQKIMGINFNLKGLIIFNLLVLPNAARPVLKSEGLVCDDDITLQYLDIIKLNNELAAAILAKNKELEQKLFNNLKFKICVMFNNSNIGARYSMNMRPFKSIYERITGKEGQFRKHAMSKRADKTARAVISPNPFLRMNELNVPEEIANNLTIPEIVSPFNYNQVLKDFQDDKITIIQKLNTNYQIDAIKYKNLKSGEIEIGDIYWRNLRNDDWVLFNRQPTLHAPSMQAMKVIVCKNKTFSFQLANCPIYNADMDGDEMNIHVPQSIEARVEMAELSSPKNWLVSEAHGGINFGFVQDSLLGLYLMTKNNDKLSKGFWFNILLNSDLKLDEIVLKINSLKIYENHDYTTRNLINCLLDSDCDYVSNNIKIKNGKIINGYFDKSEVGFGSKKFLIYYTKKFGRDKTCKLIDNIQFVTNSWIKFVGYSISLKDCKPPQDFFIEKSNFEQKYKNNKNIFLLDQFKDEIQNKVKNKLSPKNNIINLVESGSKGNWLNLTQITGILGQQYIDNNKAHAISNSEDLVESGFVFNCYYSGLSPIELWCHMRAARDAICKTATGTAITGYLQRKLIKAAENTVIQYDNTIRSGKKILVFDKTNFEN